MRYTVSIKKSFNLSNNPFWSNASVAATQENPQHTEALITITIFENSLTNRVVEDTWAVWVDSENDSKTLDIFLAEMDLIENCKVCNQTDMFESFRTFSEFSSTLGLSSVSILK